MTRPQQLTKQERSYHESSSSKASHSPVPTKQLNAEEHFSSKVIVPIDGKTYHLSAIFLRDLCECKRCVHEFTKQKLYSTTDIPADIKALSVTPSKAIANAIDITWSKEVPGFQSDHTTTLTNKTLQAIVRSGATPRPVTRDPSPPTLWDADSEDIADFDYEAYMSDDKTLLAAIEQLQTHGLVFVTAVPGVEESVATIAERIGPVKDTFYGRTWDGEHTIHP